MVGLLLATNSLKLLLKLVILGCHLLVVQLYLKIYQKLKCSSMCNMNMVGTQDTKRCILGTTFPFLFIWAWTLQDGRTLYSKKSYVFCFLSLTVLIFDFPAIFLLPRNISTFQDAIHLLKQLSFSKKFFTFVSISSHSFMIICLFCQNLKNRFCCQSYSDIIFPPETIKIEKQKTLDFLEYRVLPSCKVWAQT